MKLILISILCVSAFAADNLRSKKLKSSICYEIENEIESETELRYYETKNCEKSSMKVISKKYNPELKIYTNMKISFDFNEKEFSVKGSISAKRAISFDDNGKKKLSWQLHSLKLKLDDKRDIKDVLYQMYDDELIDTHNGDLDVRKEKLSKKQAMANLKDWYDEEESSCKFEYLDNIDDVLDSFSYHGEHFAEFLAKLKKQKKIKYAVGAVNYEGESEYCTIFTYYIMTTDGYLIYVSFEFTT